MEGESQTLTVKTRMFIYIFNAILMFLTAMASLDAFLSWLYSYPVTIAHLILVAFAAWLIMLVLGKEVVAAWRTR
jgi:hypothetical protein